MGFFKDLVEAVIRDVESSHDTSWLVPGVKAWLPPCQVAGPSTLVEIVKVEREPCYHTDPSKCPIKAWGIEVRYPDGRTGIPMVAPESFRPYKEG